MVVAELKNTNIDKIPKTIVNKKIKKPFDIVKTEMENVENAPEQNLASVNQISWLDSLFGSWWAYILGSLLIVLGIKVFLKFR